MDFIISDLVTIQEKYSITELYPLSSDYDYSHDLPELMSARVIGNPTRIRIKDEWFDVLPLMQVARSKSPEDGAFHFLYIQVNLETNEYYIGKVNRKRWSEVKRYQGSGLLFTNKYKGHERQFVRYYIACCLNQKETEDREAQIVDDVLLADPKCLNLVRGGGGTNEHYSTEKRASHQREYMKAHPEQFHSMVEVAKSLYHSGDSPQLRKRSEAIKNTMSDDKYREMTRERILRWKNEHPDEYERAREANRQAQKNPEVIEKRKQSRKKWIAEHPEEYAAQKQKLIEYNQSPEARKKRTETLKAWAKEHPEEATENTKRRTAASAAKCSKSVDMCDLKTGEVIKTFKSMRAAAQWLLDNGLATGKNPSSSISAVCQRKPCSTGYGYRKKAFGYDWRYSIIKTDEAD